MLILQPPLRPRAALAWSARHLFDLCQEDRPFERLRVHVFPFTLLLCVEDYHGYYRSDEGKGGIEGEESSGTANTFCLPQTADTIFDLIRFKDIPSLRTLLADSPILSSVSRHIK